MNTGVPSRLSSYRTAGDLNTVPWLRALDLSVLLCLGAGVYFVALWARWGGQVPAALWTQVRYAAVGGVLGLLIGGNLVSLWGRQRPWTFVGYAALVTSLSSVLLAMAATYAFRAVSLPRLTFVWALLLLWAGIMVWKGSLAIIVDRWLSRRKPGTARTRVVQASELNSIIVDGDAGTHGIMLLPNALQVILASGRLVENADHLLLEIRPRACDWPAVVFKRIVDIVVAVVGLVVLSPVYLLAMLAIRLDSPGPVLYRQTRVGQGGHPFELIKLRTMVDRAEEQTGPVLASRDDPRITRVGRWLRAFRLDEIPQLVNVLRGEMSIVGPRPERPEFVREFRKTVECYDLRHLVKPGITGLAQVRGDYDASAEDKLRFDLAYVFFWSPLMELKIILQTIGIMLTPSRALGSRSRLAAPQAKSVEPEEYARAVGELAAAGDGRGSHDGFRKERASVWASRATDK